MGFAVSYDSTRSLSEEERRAITRDAEEFANGRTWLSCEPLMLDDYDGDGRLGGVSKPTFVPAPEDVASAKREGLPDGTLQDLVEFLCELSRRHNVDWDFGCDYGPVGQIRDGVADPEVLNMVEGLASFADAARGEGDFEDEFGSFDEADEWSDEDSDDEDEDDDGPDFLKFDRP